MSLSIETLLADARKLVSRLKDHDTTADCLVARTQSLQNQFGAMKQFQDYLNELNDVARHRPRIGLIITLAQENSKIRELQLENNELRQSLDEHQSALELIMSKYREQVDKLMKANSVERSLMQQSSDQSQDLEVKSTKICEMAAIMNRAVTIDSQRTDTNRQLVKDLEFENHVMRQLLQIDDKGNLLDCKLVASDEGKAARSTLDIETQTGGDTSGSDIDDNSPIVATMVRYAKRQSAVVNNSFGPSSESSNFLQFNGYDPADETRSISGEFLTENSEQKMAMFASNCTDNDSTAKQLSSKIVTEVNGAKDSGRSSWLRDNCNCSNNNDFGVVVGEDRLNENVSVPGEIERENMSQPTAPSSATISIISENQYSTNEDGANDNYTDASLKICASENSSVGANSDRANSSHGLSGMSD